MGIVDGRKTIGRELVIRNIEDGSTTSICPEKSAIKFIHFLPLDPI